MESLRSLEAGCLALVVKSETKGQVGKVVRCLEYLPANCPTRIIIKKVNQDSIRQTKAPMWIVHGDTLWDNTAYSSISDGIAFISNMKGNGVFYPHELMRLDGLDEEERSKIWADIVVTNSRVNLNVR